MKGRTVPLRTRSDGGRADEIHTELSETVERVRQVIRGEEEHFLGTIDGGLGRIDNVFRSIGSEAVVSGKDAFEMYQTYGFPPELFETLASERGYGFDWEGFNKEMEHHGELSGPTEKHLLFQDDPLDALKKKTPTPKFLGYQALVTDKARVLAILRDGRMTEKATAGEKGEMVLVLDETPFYAEKGGQVGDTGVISGERFRFEVLSAQYDGDFPIHCGRLVEGTVSCGDPVSAAVDPARRAAIAGTHRHPPDPPGAPYQLGSHAEQQGRRFVPTNCISTSRTIRRSTAKRSRDRNRCQRHDRRPARHLRRDVDRRGAEVGDHALRRNTPTSCALSRWATRKNSAAEPILREPVRSVLQDRFRLKSIGRNTSCYGVTGMEALGFRRRKRRTGPCHR